MKWIKWYGVAMVVSSITLFCLFLFAGWHDDMAYLFFGTMVTTYTAFRALTCDWS